MERAHRSPRIAHFGVFEAAIEAEELRELLWPRDTFVDFDHGLNNAVMKLREVLGDSSEHPRYVETLPRRGYRFIAPVELKNAISNVSASAQVLTGHPVPTEGVAPEPVPDNSSLLRKVIEGQRKSHFALPRIAVLVAAVLAGSALISGITVHYVRGVNASKGRASPSSSLVVLPLENLSGDKEQDYFADGMTDDLIANLAKIRSLRVISRSTAMAYKLFAQLDAHLKSNMPRRSTSQL